MAFLSFGEWLPNNWKDLAGGGMIVIAGLLLQGCNHDDEEPTSTTTGTVGGAIRLIDQSPGVQSYLSGHPVEADPGSSVKFFPAGSISPPIPSVAYTVVNNGTTVASYAELQPPLESGSNLFHPEVSYLHLQGEPLFGVFSDLSGLPGSTSPRYRLGSRRTTSPAKQECTMEEGQIANCPLEECAARADVNLRFVGATEDLDMLLPPVACSIVASVVEGSGGASPQAYSGVYGSLVSELAGNGLTIPVLVRGAGQSVSFLAACIAQPAEEDSGFVVGSSGYSVFPLPPQVAVQEATMNCGDTVDLSIEIPVARQAGGIRGLFDINGQLEDSSDVRLSEFGNVFTAEPNPLPAGVLPDPANPWEITSAPVDDHALKARTILDNRLHIIEFPHKNNDNGRVSVEEGLVTDLGATFVASPHIQSGHFRLFDPAGNTDLNLLRQEPFFNLNSTDATSYISARGKNTNGTQCDDGGFGTGGRALSVLGGAFSGDSEGLFNYQLFLTGLSPESGNLDGTDMRCTPWRLDQLHLAIGSTSDEIHQRTDIDLLDDLDLEALAGGSGEYPEPIQMCFGQLELDIVANQSVGSIHRPRLTIRPDNETPAADGDLLSSAYDLDRSFVSAPPRGGAEPAGLVNLRGTLPERRRYKLNPRVDLVSPGGTTTQDVALEELYLPAQGTLACGAIEKACLEINDPSGSYNPLSISVSPQAAYCQQDGNLSLGIQVHSGSSEVSYAIAELFAAGDETPLPGGTECAPCGASPELALNLNDLAPGTYHLRASAFSETGLCSSELEHTFQVADQPVTLACPVDEPAPIQLPAGQASIAGDDPQIDALLNLPVTGGCSDIPYPLVDNRPSEFFPGITNVMVATPAAQIACEVPINISQSSVLGLIYMVGETAHYFDMAQGQTTVSVPVTDSSWRTRTSADGVKALFVPAGTDDAGLVFDFQDNNFQSLSGDRGVWGRFDPADTSRLAIISTTPAAGNLMNYHLTLHTAGGVQSDIIVGGDPLISEPRLAWRPDSNEIVVAYTRQSQTSALTESNYELILKRYPVGPAGFAAPYAAARTLPTPREELSDIAYIDNQTLIMVSNQRGVSRVELTSGQVTRINPADFQSQALVMNHDGSGVGFFTDQSPGFLSIPAAENPVQTVGPAIEAGKPVMAISRDLAHMAIAFPNRIDIYTLPGFEVEFSIPIGVEARGLQFRERAQD